VLAAWRLILPPNQNAKHPSNCIKSESEPNLDADLGTESATTLDQRAPSCGLALQQGVAKLDSLNL
jgi:hypothetical protein